jgi:lipoate-protein ligase A
VRELDRAAMTNAFAPAVAPPVRNETWWLLESGPGSAAWNMAIDEALLCLISRLGTVVLRLYDWSTPVATCGYLQRMAEVEGWTTLRPIVRRPTGGGLVAHDGDWTYSLAIPPEHPWYALKARASYRELHNWVRDTFRAAGLDADLAVVPTAARSGRCFLRAEVADVLWQGGKVAGAAQRRSRSGLLIQGSVRPPRHSLDRATFRSALQTEATRRWGICWQRMPTTPELNELASRLVETKYGLAAYNERR